MSMAVHAPGARFSANGTNRITKRDGREEVFDHAKIVNAVKRCMINSLGAADEVAETVARDISRKVETILVLKGEWPVGVEDIQRLVIQQLWANEHFAAAEQYQNHREEHRRARETRPISSTYAQAVAEDAQRFPTPLQYYQFVGKFARWREEDQRRETWRESCDRVMSWFKRQPKIQLTEQEWTELDASLYGLETCCAMRVVQMAGPALDRCHVGAYNCSYHPIQDIFAFAELLYILMQGTGSGFSVEHEYVGELPKVKRQRRRAKPDHFKIEDDTEAWCNALKFGMEHWFEGYDVTFDDSPIRKAGARLKTKGGRACLTGDTVVYKDRKKSTGANTLTIAELHEKRLQTPRRLRHIKIRCLDEATGTFQRNRIVDVIDNGVAAVYEVMTTAGYRIKATGNHRFMNADRVYQHLDLFHTGDLIAVNGAEVKSGRCETCDAPVSRRAQHCRPCANQAQIKPDANPTTARARTECQQHNVGVCAVCGRDDLPTQVHHKDRNPLHNDGDNCLCVCEPCHRTLHTAEDTFGNPYAHRYLSFDRIVSIKYVGQERVYDLCMEAPNHNFVANGFVSHNSGPEPLRELLRFARTTVLNRQGGVLTDLDCHDICCVEGKIVQVGGVRRASCISISELMSQLMREAKSGNWYDKAKWRTMANNSAAYSGRPDDVTFMREWLSLAESGSGERGIFNRKAVEMSIPKRRKRGPAWGMNPCGEIILRPWQFCNLSICVARPYDTRESLKRKVRIAAYWGTMQKTCTEFRYLRPEWKKNCEEEALLGVDITGHADCPLLRYGAPGRAELLRELRQVVAEVDTTLSQRWSINRSAADTCVKPSGDSSVFFDCSSGVGAHHSTYRIRWVRESIHSPVTKLLIEEGVPHAVSPEDESLMVFGFPKKAPEGATLRNDLTAIQQLENWLEWKRNWAEHSVACTIHVEPHEWLAVGNWVLAHFDEITGLSFLPKDNGIYSYAPNEEITKEQYEAMVAKFPKINWAKLARFEEYDQTVGSRTYACLGERCEFS